MISPDFFRFLSPRERKQRLDDYQNQIFPFGESQKEAVSRLLGQLFTEKKRDEKERLYAFASARDSYLNARPELREEALVQWFRTAHFFPEDKLRVIALVLLDAECRELSAYPDAEQVLRKAEALRGQLG